MNKHIVNVINALEYETITYSGVYEVKGEGIEEDNSEITVVL